MQILARSFLLHREADQSRPVQVKIFFIEVFSAHSKTSSYLNEEVSIYADCNGFR